MPANAAFKSGKNASAKDMLDQETSHGKLVCELRLGLQGQKNSLLSQDTANTKNKIKIKTFNPLLSSVYETMKVLSTGKRMGLMLYMLMTQQPSWQLSSLSSSHGGLEKSG